MKNKKNIIIAIGGALLVITAFLTRKKWMPIFFKDKGDEKAADELAEDKAQTNEQGKAWTPPTSAKESFPLKKGMAGGKTQAMQKALSIKADGIFGKDTQASVESWGYSVPVSKTDYDNILSGSRKQDLKVATGKMSVGKNVFSAVTANLKSLGVNTSQRIQLTKGKLVGKVNKIKSDYVWVNATDGRTIGIATGNLYA